MLYNYQKHRKYKNHANKQGKNTKSVWGRGLVLPECLKPLVYICFIRWLQEIVLDKQRNKRIHRAKKETKHKQKIERKKLTATLAKKVVTLGCIKVTIGFGIQIITECSNDEVVHKSTRFKQLAKRPKSASDTTKLNSIFTESIREERKPKKLREWVTSNLPTKFGRS